MQSHDSLCATCASHSQLLKAVRSFGYCEMGITLFSIMYCNAGCTYVQWCTVLGHCSVMCNSSIWSLPTLKELKEQKKGEGKTRDADGNEGIPRGLRLKHNPGVWANVNKRVSRARAPRATPHTRAILSVLQRTKTSQLGQEGK